MRLSILRVDTTKSRTATVQVTLWIVVREWLAAPIGGIVSVVLAQGRSGRVSGVASDATMRRIDERIVDTLTIEVGIVDRVTIEI